MSKMASNAKFKQFVTNLSVEDQRTVIERQSRLLPAFIMQEVASTNNPKVIRGLPMMHYATVVHRWSR